MMKNMKPRKKYLIGIFLVVILMVGAVWMLQNREIEIRFDENGSLIVPDKPWYEGQIQYMKKVADLETRLLEMEKQDNFGGATPQETFDAFVEALKVGDTELASRYFVFNKQEQMAKEFAIGKENDNLDFLIDYLEKGDDGDEIRHGYFRFTVVEENIAIMSFDLQFNEDTKVWKMESL